MTLIAHTELKSQVALNHTDWRNVPGLSIWLETEERPVMLEAYMGLFVQTGVSTTPEWADIQIVDFTNMSPLSWVRVEYPNVTGDVISQTTPLKALIPAGQPLNQYVVQVRVGGGNHYYAPSWQSASVPMFTAVEL